MIGKIVVETDRARCCILKSAVIDEWHEDRGCGDRIERTEVGEYLSAATEIQIAGGMIDHLSG
jgi:hypothetical protein